MKADKKIKAITCLLSRLRQKKQVRPEEFSKLFTKQQRNDFAEHLAYQKKLEKVKRPAVIQKYAEMVRIGCLHYAKMEYYQRPPSKPDLSRKFSDKADSAFEQALDFIREAVQINPELKTWIDRDLNDIRSYCPIGIPRVIGSDSAMCRDKSKQPNIKISKRELLIEHLELALYDLQDHTLEQFMYDEPVDLYGRNKRIIDVTGFKF